MPKNDNSLLNKEVRSIEINTVESKNTKSYDINKMTGKPVNQTDNRQEG